MAQTTLTQMDGLKVYTFLETVLHCGNRNKNVNSNRSQMQYNFFCIYILMLELVIMDIFNMFSD